MLKAILFDMDGVIVNTEPLHRKAYYQLFKDVNIQVSDKLYATFTGQSTLTICKQLCTKFNLPLCPETLVGIKRDHFKSVFAASELTLLDGVLDLIKSFHRKGMQLVLASSASMENINAVFNRFDLDRYFVAKLSGSELAASKPHPEIFEKAAIASGQGAHECLVIEDSTNGIKAAKAAGIFCVGYDSCHSLGQDYSLADMVIKHFTADTDDKIQSVFDASPMARA